MLAIRMQRIGRKGYPMYRVVVQESHRHPTSGRIVTNLGSYNPHSKESAVDIKKAEQFLNDGAQPSDRVIRLLQDNKVKLPKWVKLPAVDKKKTIKNSEKLRKNQPKEEPVEETKAETPESQEAEVTDKN